MSLIKFDIIKQNLRGFWESSKFFRVWLYALSVIAVLGFVAWGVLSVALKDNIQTAKMLYDGQILGKTANFGKESAQNFTFRTKIKYSNPILRHQRHISYIEIVDIAWSGLDESAIIDTQIKEDKYKKKSLEITTTQDLNILRGAELGTLTYKTSFALLPMGIALYYFGLIFAAFILIILWRHFKLYTFLALAFLAFCDFVVSVSDDKLTLVPFGLIGLVGFGLCVFIAFHAKNSKAKMIFAYFSVLPLCLGILEFYLFNKFNEPQMSRPHYILGFANTPLYEGNLTRIVDGKLVYDVFYKHDGYGNRITPNNNENSKKCIAIYGGSFAYGTAINNDETLGFYLAKNLPEFKLLNFGISGAGAHTMLARLEFNMDKKVLDKCDELIAIYVAIPHHIHRVYGAYLGPNYQPDKQGNPIYWGTFKEGEYAQTRFNHKTAPKINAKPTNEIHKNSIHQKFSNTLKDIFNVSKLIKNDKSYIKKQLNKKREQTSEEFLEWFKRFGLYYNAAHDIVDLKQDEIGLYFAIIKRIQEQLQSKYNTRLYIVLWDYDVFFQSLDKYDQTLKENFTKMGVKFWSLSEMIEDYVQDYERVKRGDYDNFKYRVSRWDTHPNALANEKIAEFLAEKIKNGDIKSHKVKSAQSTTKDSK